MGIFFQSILLHPLITLSTIFHALRMVVGQLLNGVMSLGRICFSANFAITHSRRLQYIGIFRRELVSIFTMRLGGIQNRRTKTTQPVCFRGDRLNMHGVNAMPYATQMVTMLLGGNYANKQLINQSMSAVCPAFPRHPTVSFSINPCNPFPTRNTFIEMSLRHLYLGKDTNKQIQSYGQSVNIIVSHCAKYSNYLVMWLRLREMTLSKSFISLSLVEV